MIVRHHEKGWKIVSQYTHGLLAGKIALQLAHALRPHQWSDTLTAIIEHDDHQLDFKERSYLTENGTPMDFAMSGGTDREALEHAEMIYENGRQKSQFVAMLIGRHLDFLYGDMAKEFPPMENFLGWVREKGKAQRRLYGLNKKAQEAIYAMMLFCDRCSLILCQDGIPEVGRRLEINRTIDNNTFFISRGESGDITVEPWPFESNEFGMNFEYRLVTEIKFKSDTELESAIKNAKVSLCFLNFKK